MAVQDLHIRHIKNIEEEFILTTVKEPWNFFPGSDSDRGFSLPKL
jgi:hypothetical protein